MARKRLINRENICFSVDKIALCLTLFKREGERSVFFLVFLGFGLTKLFEIFVECL